MSDSIFITQSEVDCFNAYASEMLSKVSGQSIHFLEVDKVSTPVDDVYGEASEGIFYKNPIKINALVKIMEWEDNLEHGPIYESPKLEVYLTKKSLDEIALQTPMMMIGNYFVWGEHLYEILTCVASQLVYGEPDWSFGAIMTCQQKNNITKEIYALIKGA